MRASQEGHVAISEELIAADVEVNRYNPFIMESLLFPFDLTLMLLPKSCIYIHTYIYTYI